MHAFVVSTAQLCWLNIEEMLFLVASLLLTLIASADNRNLIGFETLSLFNDDFLQSIPAGPIEYGLAKTADDAHYQSSVNKGKRPTTTTTSTTTITTTTTTTTDFLLIDADAALTCSENCATAGYTCYQGGQERINTMQNECFGQYSAQGTTAIPGYEFSYPEFFPTGCFVYDSLATEVVMINTNDFGTGLVGCNAPGAVDGPIDAR
eukprot:Lankesteria_metandrocarpae@DN7538_c0_g1_i1.p1